MTFTKRNPPDSPVLILADQLHQWIILSLSSLMIDAMNEGSEFIQASKHYQMLMYATEENTHISKSIIKSAK